MKKSSDIDKRFFLKKFEKIQDNFSQILKNYIKNSNDENIHDIRITIRRLETAHRILPKNIRKKEKITNYIKQAKKLFKLNAEIRDYDIICAKMASKYKDQTYDLVSTTKKSRIKKLRIANQIALEIFHTDIPKISGNIIKKSKLYGRYFEVLDKIELDIQKNTIIALGDEKKIDELHLLRKDFKKLRYSLELSSNRGKTIQILKNLKEIQDLLGDIHDSDIIIEYLRNLDQNSKYLGIIESEVLERSKKYHAFVTAFNEKRPKMGYF
jgi:CHAD domain-containing protein